MINIISIQKISFVKFNLLDIILPSYTKSIGPAGTLEKDCNDNVRVHGIELKSLNAQNEDSIYLDSTMGDDYSLFASKMKLIKLRKSCRSGFSCQTVQVACLRQKWPPDAAAWCHQHTPGAQRDMLSSFIIELDMFHCQFQPASLLGCLAV